MFTSPLLPWELAWVGAQVKKIFFYLFIYFVLLGIEKHWVPRPPSFTENNVQICKEKSPSITSTPGVGVGYRTGGSICKKEIARNLIKCPDLHRNVICHKPLLHQIEALVWFLAHVQEVVGLRLARVKGEVAWVEHSLALNWQGFTPFRHKWVPVVPWH